MCGIFCSVGSICSLKPSTELKEWLKNRGPDSSSEHCLTLQGPQVSHLTFISTVLALRGNHVQVQPLIDDISQSVFCWNGEAWKVGDTVVSGNDSVYIFHLLLEASKQSYEGTDDGVVTILNAISGPFAFVFYEARSQKIFYGRDRLGRRSLVCQVDDSRGFLLSSICDHSDREWTEVPYDGVQVLNLARPCNCRTHHAWSDSIPPINRSSLSIRPPSLDLESSSLANLHHLLHKSLQSRVADIPSLGLSGRHEIGSSDARLAVLFSGGLDCSVLARLAHDILPPSQSIDLLNVAFENPRSAGKTASHPNSSPYEICPDRITGRRSIDELSAACPGRKFNFLAINIPYVESQAHRSTILRLIYPHNTEMDLSIAKALYFASRASINVKKADLAEDDMNSRGYASSARVLLSGLGADELFAGYTRHATAFARKGYHGLNEELSLDITRLGQRNLGRDDRIISHWGKEARYPYLDEELVRWALNAPIWEKCGFGSNDAEIEAGQAQRPRGTKQKQQQPIHEQDIEPAKKILRLLAQKLGLEGVAREKKRAIQFGARTAKMEGGKTKGTDILT